MNEHVAEVFTLVSKALNMPTDMLITLIIMRECDRFAQSPNKYHDELIEYVVEVLGNTQSASSIGN